MSASVGATRVAEGLSTAAERIAGFASAVLADSASVPLMELHNLITVAALIVQAALCREETRGVHARLDYPARDDEHWGGTHVRTRRAATSEPVLKAYAQRSPKPEVTRARARGRDGSRGRQ
jgi:L-aspartate oxidase